MRMNICQHGYEGIFISIKIYKQCFNLQSTNSQNMHFALLHHNLSIRDFYTDRGEKMKEAYEIRERKKEKQRMQSEREKEKMKRKTGFRKR